MLKIEGMALNKQVRQCFAKKAVTGNLLELTLDFFQSLCDTDGVGEGCGLVVMGVSGRDGVELV